ncbi:small GTP-binding protein domain [Clostridium sp. CAG:169]|nr:small GTP-binding protein domain [Clostridium sp. CAG:169]
MADLQRMECSFEPPVTEEDGVLLCGRGSAQALSGYGLEFISYTRGKGILSLSFDGYEPCAHPQQVIEEIGYDAKHDLQNPSFSVFCSHGAGFPVPWQEVPAYIHCK